MDPASSADRRAIEVYPHPATVVLFGLDKTLKYKNKPGRVRRTAARAAQADDADRGARPRRRRDCASTATWTGSRCGSGSRPRPGRAQLDRDEDPVDAVLCAYVALYWYHRPEDVTIYGDVETGYIVTPTLPADLIPGPAQARGATPE